MVSFSPVGSSRGVGVFRTNMETCLITTETSISSVRSTNGDQSWTNSSLLDRLWQSCGLAELNRHSDDSREREGVEHGVEIEVGRRS